MNMNIFDRLGVELLGYYSVLSLFNVSFDLEYFDSEVG